MHPMRAIVQLFASRSTASASVGHFRAQMPQKMQSSISISIRPRVFSVHSRGFMGYISVAGFLNRLRRIIFPILRFAMSLTYLSVQLMQGSIVSINTGTSASSQPCSVLTSAGIFALVGVRTRILSRNFVPEPFE